MKKNLLHEEENHPKCGYYGRRIFNKKCKIRFRCKDNDNKSLRQSHGKDIIMKVKIILADVHYSPTDETYYVLNGISRFADNYKTDTLYETFLVLKADGWSKCGKVQRWDYSPVDLFVRNNSQIAVWSEVEVGEEDQEEEELRKALGNNSVWMGEKRFQYKCQPIAKKLPVSKNGERVYLRNGKVAINALTHANFKCEVDEKHPTFIRKYSTIPYTEPHHLIPMKYSDQFDVSLDVEENIVSLCSNCHNHLHYGKDSEEILKKFYIERKEVLRKAGIELSEVELLEMYY